jgi:hypothetical protein
MHVQETQQYKQAFARLRDLKPQIEQLQALLQRSHTESHDPTPPAVQDTSGLRAPTTAGAAAAASTDHVELHNQHNSPVSLGQPEQAAAAEDQMLQSAFAEQPPEQQPGAAPQPAVADGTAAARQAASLAPLALPDGANGFR